MSKENHTQMRDGERGLIVLEATWGIDALLILLTHALKGHDSGEVAWATKEALKRIKQLNFVIMSAIGDDEDNEALRNRV